MPCTILIIKYLLKFYEILNKVDIIARLIIYCFTLHKHLWDFNPCLHFVFKNIIILYMYIYRILNYQLIIREMVSSTTSQNPMNKWRVDLSGSSGGSRALIKSATSDQTLNPPGYSPGFVASQKVEAASKTEQQQQHLIGKRAWEIALGPLKALPMNMFMMYMAGNTISIFPIMMVVMMAWRPIKALLSVNAAFKPLEQEHAGTLLLHKLIFALGNLAAIVLAVYKCHTMGLLPSHESDWLDFMPIPERMQYALFSAFPTD